MIGHHVAALIADAYMKGYRDFDVNQAYAGDEKGCNRGDDDSMAERSSYVTGSRIF